MLKQILNLKGAQALSKKEQKIINGGGFGATPCDNGPIPSSDYGKCYVAPNCYKIYLCTDTCPDGTDPFCNTQP
jgi:hypothetical protein